MIIHWTDDISKPIAKPEHQADPYILETRQRIAFRFYVFLGGKWHCYIRTLPMGTTRDLARRGWIELLKRLQHVQNKKQITAALAVAKSHIAQRAILPPDDQFLVIDKKRNQQKETQHESTLHHQRTQTDLEILLAEHSLECRQAS